MSNKQRKGQWLYNKIRTSDRHNRETTDEQVGRILWNMSDEEFDKYIKEYNDQ